MEVIISNCTGTGYSAYGEFELHATCDIPVAAADALRLLVGLAPPSPPSPSLPVPPNIDS